MGMAESVRLGTESNEMVVYTPNQRVDESTLVDLGDIGNLGGVVLEGEPKVYGRIDYSEGGVTAGIFKGTRGVVRIVFPFSEHATLLEGVVKLTDEAGRSHTFKKGESYFIRQGQVILWEVKSKYFIKSFLNIVR